MGLIDRLTLGPARRRRRIRRQVRALDREYAAWARGRTRPRRHRVDVRGTAALLVALGAGAMLVVAQPGLLPAPVRDLTGLGCQAPGTGTAARRIGRVRVHGAPAG